MIAIDYLRGVRREPADIVKAVLVLGVGLPVVAVGVAVLGFFATFYMFPPATQIPSPRPGVLAETSKVYAADGSLIAAFHAERNRELIKLSQVPKHLQRAVVAAEDARFYEHSGVDFQSVVRALVADVQAGGSVQGGSTITQQYVKNTYVGSERTLLRKIREARIAAQLERTWSKTKILERYLNTIYLGRGAYGVQAAAQTYFDKPASELSLSESAMLAGLIPAPERFSPYEDPGAAEIRRTFVINRMEELGFLTAEAAADARADRPKLTEQKKGQEVFQFPWFVDAVSRYLIKQYGEEAVFTGGLEITTTLDPAMQRAAEDVLRKTLNSPDDPYAALASIDPKTGYVKALVGGRDFATEKFNIAIQGPRQPGSSFKPFVLVAALEGGIGPQSRYSGPATICLDAWRPDCTVNNFDDQGFGDITLENATINSVNTVYAQLVLDVGPKNVVDVAKRMGISGMATRKMGITTPPIDPFPALALGSEEATPFEMASAFATLAARGVYHEPKVVSRVVDRSGKVLEEGPSEPVRAMDEVIADTANRILQGVVQRGTGTRAAIDRPAAGKTGTAQDFRNAWFVGYTPDLSTAVWMGYRDRNREMLNVHGVGRVVGGTIPAQMWSKYMTAALAPVEPSDFPEPMGDLPLGRFRLPSEVSTAPSPEPSPSSPEPTPSPSASPKPKPSKSPSPSPESSFPIPLPFSSPEPRPSPSPKPSASPEAGQSPNEGSSSSEPGPPESTPSPP